MSHNHYLECGACRVTTETQSESNGDGHPGSCYSKFSICYGDALVENALATKALRRDGIEITQGSVWVNFIAEHASCNAFSEICSQHAPCAGTPRIIPVRGQKVPCASCNGGRVIRIPCPSCYYEGAVRDGGMRVYVDYQEIARMTGGDLVDRALTVAKAYLERGVLHSVTIRTSGKGGDA